jgi:hypothetical protein
VTQYRAGLSNFQLTTYNSTPMLPSKKGVLPHARARPFRDGEYATIRSSHSSTHAIALN